MKQATTHQERKHVHVKHVHQHLQSINGSNSILLPL